MLSSGTKATVHTVCSGTSYLYDKDSNLDDARHCQHHSDMLLVGVVWMINFRKLLGFALLTWHLALYFSFAS